MVTRTAEYCLTVIEIGEIYFVESVETKNKPHINATNISHEHNIDTQKEEKIHEVLFPSPWNKNYQLSWMYIDGKSGMTTMTTKHYSLQRISQTFKINIPPSQSKLFVKFLVMKSWKCFVWTGKWNELLEKIKIRWTIVLYVTYTSVVNETKNKQKLLKLSKLSVHFLKSYIRATSNMQNMFKLHGSKKSMQTNFL